MSFEIKTKKAIPSENETRVRILSIAMNLGCFQEVKKIFDKHNEYMIKPHSQEELMLVAQDTIVELFKLDPKLVSWLLNENGEIVIGNKVGLKVNIK